jgi:mono/diheme cytochrome c family protein
MAEAPRCSSGVPLLGAVLLAACAAAHGDDRPAAAPAAAPQEKTSGQQLYGRHCLSCHQADGGGVFNMQPPIKGGTWVTGDPRPLALFVMTGGFDSAARKDSDNGNVMPAFRQVSDDELAQILTFIRAKFGNGASPVSAALVAEARASLPP